VIAALALVATLAQDPVLFPVETGNGTPGAGSFVMCGFTDADEPPDDPALERRRILRLADGAFVRGKTRLADGAWQRYADRAWTAVDGDVVSFRTERDVEAEARRLAAGLGRDAAAERVALADWMLTQGLEREAVTELERVLARSPDHPAALALIGARPIGLELDGPFDRDDPAGELAALVRTGAGGRAATREIAVRRIADFDTRRGVRFDVTELVRKELATRQPTRRAFAALVARRLLEGELRRELSRAALVDGMPDVRRDAALALRDAHGLAGLGVPIAALEAHSPALRVRAVEALDVIGNAAAVGPLVAHLASLAAGGGAPTGVRGNLSIGLQTSIVGDYDVEIAQNASIGDPQVRIQDSGVVHDARAQAQITREVEMRTTIGVLTRLTGVELDGPDAWQAWWREHAADWNAAAERPAISAR
jgi:hypothetical protein